MTDPLLAAARHGRWVLVAGLVVGLAAPWLAEAMRPTLRPLVVVLLFVSFLRMDWTRAQDMLRGIPQTASVALALQLGLPLIWLAVAGLCGIAHTGAAVALMLMLAAPSIAGSPNIAIMLGAAPDKALRLMVTGTVLLPLTVLPVFALSPALDGATMVIRAAMMLVATIAVTALLAWAIRRRWQPDAVAQTRLDGASSITLAVFVIGLMPQVSVVALHDPLALAGWAALAFGANLGLQIVTWRMTARLRLPLPFDTRLPLALISGNRNIALFLVSLPAEITTPLLPFIGCYQLPMYLTPLIMRRVYAQTPGA